MCFNASEMVVLPDQLHNATSAAVVAYDASVNRCTADKRISSVYRARVGCCCGATNDDTLVVVLCISHCLRRKDTSVSTIDRAAEGKGEIVERAAVDTIDATFGTASPVTVSILDRSKCSVRGTLP